MLSLMLLILLLKTATGISSVSLNGESCTSASGCIVTGLIPGQSYILTATISDTYQYAFNSWSNSASIGTITDASSASTTFTVGAGATTLTPSAIVKTYTCTKQYRLQRADGTYPDAYTIDDTVNVTYGSTCNYTKSVNYYISQSDSATVTAPVTLSLSLPRTTYVLTINHNVTHIASVTGSGTYRWGEEVNIMATPEVDSAFDAWTQTSGNTGSFNNASAASTTFTMPTSAATIYANGEPAIYIYEATFSDCGSNMWDDRDGIERKYTTAKINDLCWMTTNLSLGTNTTVTLTNENTNLNDNYFLHWNCRV